MTTPQLLRAVERFVASAREAHRRAVPAGGGESPFFYSSDANPPDTRATAEHVLGEWRLSAPQATTPEPRREACALTAGGVKFVYYAFKGDRYADGALSPDYLSLHYTLSGRRVLSVGSTVIATSKENEYLFATNRSPLFRMTLTDDLAGLSVFIPIPTEQRFSLRAGRKGGDEARPELDDGFFLVGESRLWDTHIAYALEQAIDQALAADLSKAARPASGAVLDEYLYLLFRQELAAQARLREIDQPFVIIPFKLKVAEAFVTENAAEAPSVEQVAATVKLSARNLHSLFVRFRGVSPRDFIRERRLLGIRSALRSSGPDATVADIASSWGFQNFGNFAAAYKKRFGELPSETLRHSG